MKRNLIMLFAVIFFILVFLTNTYSSEEIITLDTIYPAPSGAYSLLRVMNIEGPPPIPPIIHDLSMTYNSGINFFTFTFTGSDAGSDGDGLLFTHDGTSNDFVLDSNGNVGIGTNSPHEKLHIVENANDFVGIKIENTNTGSNSSEGIYFSDEEGNSASILLFDDTDTGYPSALLLKNYRTGGYINITAKEYVVIASLGVSLGYIKLDSTGNVGIGVPSPNYKLDVNGNIRATGSVYYGGSLGEEIDATAYTKLDYVFSEGYNAMSTDEVEKYLKEEGHLPWATSLKKEKQENGDATNMTRMAFETVETVENLQLQIILLNKTIKALEEKINQISQDTSR